MNTTVSKPKTTAAIQTAAGQGMATRPQSGCIDCNKVGLAILPVVPALVPNSLRNTSKALKALDGKLQTDDLKAHWYVMRTLPAGYLYLLKPDLTWDGYAVDNEGLLRQMPVGTMPVRASDTPPMSQACKRSADNIPAQVIAVDPTKHASVWLAFSRYRWTNAVLADYAKNKDACRDKRMTKLDVMAAAQGSLGATSKASNAVKFGAPMSADVGQYVADYADAATVATLNKHMVTPIRARAGNAAALAAKMAAISSETTGRTGAIICLSDVLGVTIDANAARNAETARLGAYIAANQQKRFTGEVITAFEKAFTENGQAAKWTERYKPKYKAQQIKADLALFEKTAKPWEGRINAMSRDVASLNGAESLKPYWRDFDPLNDLSAIDRQNATAACLHGAVKTAEEQALWDRWFEEDPRDPYSTLWGAVTGMDARLGDYLFGKQLPDTGKFGSLPDVAKNIRDAHEDFKNRQAKRAADDALALIGVAMASQITRLKSVNPALYKVAGMRVLMVIAARTTVTATPAFVAMTHTQQALMLAEATFGPPEPSMKRLLDVESTSSKRVYVVGSNGVDAYAWEGTQTTKQKARIVELWLPDELAKGMPSLPSPADLKALPAPKVNPFSALVKFTKSLPGALAWVGLTFQVLNLSNSAKDLLDADVKDKTDAYFGNASGILGVTGVMAEITAGAMEKMAGRYAAPAIGRVVFAGGALASLAAVAEAVQLMGKSVDRYKAHDRDAGLSYALSGFAMIGAGLAGMGASLAVASTAGSLTGVLGFLAGPGSAAAAVVPVWGWITVGVIFLGVGLYKLWQAIEDTDTPMEVWLLGSIYGNGKPMGPKLEMSELNKIMYVMTIEAEWSDDAWEWRNTAFYDDYDNFRFAISLPSAGAHSLLDCKVTLVGKRGRKEVFHETIRPRMLGGVPADPHMAVISATPPSDGKRAAPEFVWWEAPRISKDGKRYGGQLKLNDNVYSSAEVEIKYWPDQQNMPSLVLPAASEQRTLVGSD